jgi:hypothetical protein
MINEHKGFFYLIYNQNKNELEIKFPSYNSTPFLRVKGRKAEKMYDALRNILDVHRLNSRIIKEGGIVTRELPAAVGLSVVIFMLASRNLLNPAKYLFIIEQMSNGSLPLSKYLADFVGLSIGLSALINKETHNQLVSPKAATIVGRALRKVLDGLKPEI